MVFARSLTEKRFPFFLGETRLLAEWRRHVDLDNAAVGAVRYPGMSAQTFDALLVLIVLIVVRARGHSGPLVLAFGQRRAGQERLPLINITGLCHPAAASINRCLNVPLVALSGAQRSVEASVIVVQTSGLRV